MQEPPVSEGLMGLTPRVLPFLAFAARVRAGKISSDCYQWPAAMTRSR